MMIWQLVKSGLRSNKGTFIGLTLLSLLTSAMLTFAICMYADLSDRQAEALREAHAGDVLTTGGNSGITDELVSEIESVDGVGSVQVTDAVIASTCYYSSSGKALGEKNVMNVVYQPWNEAIEFNQLAETDESVLQIVAHEDAISPKSGEVFVPIGTSATLGLSLGDEVVVTIGETEHRLIVTSFIEDPQLGSPFVEMGQYLVSEGDFEKMQEEVMSLGSEMESLLAVAAAGAAYPVRVLNMYMTDDARDGGLTPSEFAKRLDENVESLAAASTSLLSSEVLTGYAMLVVIISCAIFLVFALLLLLITLVICLHTISVAIQQGYVDFAVLKAVGLPNAVLRRALVLQYALCVVVGSILGVLAGAVLLGPALTMFAPLTGVLARPNIPIVPVAFILLALLLVTISAVAIRTGKIAKISPLEGLRSGLGDVHFKSRATVSAAGRPLGFRLALRAVTSAKRNYIGLFACAFLLAAFVMLTFGIGGSLKTMEDSYDAFGVWQSDLSVKLSDGVTIEDVEGVVEEVAPIKRVWQERFTMLNLDGQSRTILGLTDFSVTSGIAEGRAPVYDNEVVIGYNLAAFAGKGIGDEILIPDSNGKERPFLVTGLLSGMFNAGYGIMTAYDAVGDLGYSSESDEVLYQIQLVDPAQSDSARELVEQHFGDSIDTSDTGLFMSTKGLMVLIHDLFILIGYSMDVVAVLMAFLAASLIISRMFSSERRDLGIFRAVGFSSRDLRVQFALRFLIVSLLGCVLAAIVVCAEGSWLVSQLFGMFGVTRFHIEDSPFLIGGIAFLLTMLFFVAAYWSSRKVRDIPINVLVVE